MTVFDEEDWRDCTVTYLTSFLPEAVAGTVCDELRKYCEEKVREEDEEDHGWIDDEDAGTVARLFCTLELHPLLTQSVTVFSR